MNNLPQFNEKQIGIINDSVVMAEELVNNYYKLSTSQWLDLRYDVQTLAGLEQNEIIPGPFAHIIRYRGKPKNRHLESYSFDFYKICIQDHEIMDAVRRSEGLDLFPFSLYIVTHELIHVVRFCKFLQNFDASPNEKLSEEKRVHGKTRDILGSVSITGLSGVFEFYNKWDRPTDCPGNL